MPPMPIPQWFALDIYLWGWTKITIFVKYNHSNRSQLLKDLCVLQMCQVLLNDIEYRISINLECFND